MKMKTADRRAALAAYKQKKPAAGVYVVRCAATGEAWIGMSRHLESQQTSLWFQLRHAGLPNAALRSAWLTCGEHAFGFEVLETVDAELTPLGLTDFLKRRAAHWREELGAKAV